MGYFAHPSAIIDEGAEIGEGSRIWHFVHVALGARIGGDVTLGQNVYVGGGAIIGDGCRIQNNVSIYDGVTLEEDVFCGPSMVFTNVTNPRAKVARKDEYRPTLVRRGASLGANCTIVCGATVGAFAFVAAGAVITHEVPDYAMVAGVPARQIGWMSEHGDRLALPLEGEGEANCPGSGAAYRVRGGRCTRVGE